MLRKYPSKSHQDTRKKKWSQVVWNEYLLSWILNPTLIQPRLPSILSHFLVIKLRSDRKQMKTDPRRLCLLGHLPCKSFLLPQSKLQESMRLSQKQNSYKDGGMSEPTFGNSVCFTHTYSHGIWAAMLRFKLPESAIYVSNIPPYPSQLPRPASQVNETNSISLFVEQKTEWCLALLSNFLEVE